MVTVSLYLLGAAAYRNSLYPVAKVSITVSDNFGQLHRAIGG